ncbi:cysteine desulfurase [candidate division WOR-1 bacterium DG_54_3]|uniref:Cysteine desulfurase IscS n=1 Tax=candidate division WOR-1 bacterium DG_54_3 TaxID=1703775 RepID=A0A0S7Y3G8_UNCSA|nr:MAG: cysteine desulfurase [candidate division WOR-1 bacterium DG_54_3]
MKKIYLDHAATTPTHPEVVEEMRPYFSEKFGNPSSIHFFGREAKTAIEKARERVAELISAKSEEIVFTSGGTESNNFTLHGIAYANEKKGNHIITTPIEHHALLEPCKFLESRGLKVTYLPVDKHGLVNPEDVRKAVTDKTILVSVMHANNEIGTIEPISEISRIVKEKEIYFHTDAVQTVGAIPVNIDELGVDLLSISSHKLYGPKGVGALYVRKGTRMIPFLRGGEQERNRRASTENVTGIIGFGKACELARIELQSRIEHLTPLRDKLINGIMDKIPDVVLNGHPTQRLPKNVDIAVKYVEGESMLLNLDMEGIACSTGSACSSGSLEPSHVLLAIGLSPELAHGSLRFTLGRLTIEKDIEYVLEILPRIVKKLRELSPLSKKEKQ